MIRVSKAIEQIAPRLYQCDQKLHQLLSKLELLQYINPINSEKERLKFYRSRYYYEPDFRYPKCQHNLSKIRKQLNSIKVHKIEHVIYSWIVFIECNIFCFCLIICRKLKIFNVVQTKVNVI